MAELCRAHWGAGADQAAGHGVGFAGAWLGSLVLGSQSFLVTFYLLCSWFGGCRPMASNFWVLALIKRCIPDKHSYGAEEEKYIWLVLAAGCFCKGTSSPSKLMLCKNAFYLLVLWVAFKVSNTERRPSESLYFSQYSGEGICISTFREFFLLPTDFHTQLQWRTKVSYWKKRYSWILRAKVGQT